MTVVPAGLDLAIDVDVLVRCRSGIICVSRPRASSLPQAGPFRTQQHKTTKSVLRTTAPASFTNPLKPLRHGQPFPRLLKWPACRRPAFLFLAKMCTNANATTVFTAGAEMRILLLWQPVAYDMNVSSNSSGTGRLTCCSVFFLQNVSSFHDQESWLVAKNVGLLTGLKKKPQHRPILRVS